VTKSVQATAQGRSGRRKRETPNINGSHRGEKLGGLIKKDSQITIRLRNAIALLFVPMPI